MHWLERRIPPPVVGAFVAAAMWAASHVGPYFVLGGWPRIALVALVAAAGMACDLLGLVAFRRARTTVNPLKPERASTLVTGGIYRITRNPMYLGMGLLLAGWAVYLAAWLPLAGPFAYVWYITRFQIAAEERVLAGRFGDEYAAYLARVRRWL